jgi:branched-chain amino acid aminotransferase
MTQNETPTHETTKSSTHDVIPNSKNESIVVSSALTLFLHYCTKGISQVGMRDGLTGKFNLVPRSQAVVSVFDSNFLIGDGLWVS